MQMTTDRACAIISRLKQYTESAEWAEFEKDNPTVTEQIKKLKAQDIRFGECATFGTAKIVGDLTADGVRYLDARGKKANAITAGLDDGYVQRYKLACGFESSTLLILSNDNAADPATCKIIARKLDFSGYSKESDSYGIAQSTAKSVATQELKRLDYKLENVRVNDYNLEYTYGPFPVLVYPIFADLKDKKGKVHPTVIGTYAETDLNNGETLDVPEIDVNVKRMIQQQKLGSKTSKAAKKKKILTAVFGCLGALAVVGVLAYIFISCAY